MTDNTPMGKEQHHASNALAIAGLVVLIVMNVLAIADHIFPKWYWMAVAIAGTLAFAYVNFKNTVQENSPWKSYGGTLMILATAAIYAAPIGTAYIHQP
jgi:uncharacterized membrane protein